MKQLLLFSTVMLSVGLLSATAEILGKPVARHGKGHSNAPLKRHPAHPAMQPVAHFHLHLN